MDVYTRNKNSEGTSKKSKRKRKKIAGKGNKEKAGVSAPDFCEQY
jgi:hypothetical protein